MDWIYFFDLVGTAVFALTGILAAARHNMDVFGALVLAAVTAVGGGTVRDIALGATPVFWITDPNYIYVVMLTLLLTMLFWKTPTKAPKSVLPIADACGLALFCVIGADKALSFGHDGMIAVIMGVITGVGGGVIRDILCRQVPMVLRTEIYATAAILGGIVYTLGIEFNWHYSVTAGLALLSALTLRLAALYWHLSLPIFREQQLKD